MSGKIDIIGISKFRPDHKSVLEIKYKDGYSAFLSIIDLSGEGISIRVGSGVTERWKYLGGMNPYQPCWSNRNRSSVPILNGVTCQEVWGTRSSAEASYMRCRRGWWSKIHSQAKRWVISTSFAHLYSFNIIYKFPQIRYKCCMLHCRHCLEFMSPRRM